MKHDNPREWGAGGVAFDEVLFDTGKNRECSWCGHISYAPAIGLTSMTCPCCGTAVGQCWEPPTSASEKMLAKFSSWFDCCVPPEKAEAKASSKTDMSDRPWRHEIFSFLGEFDPTGGMRPVPNVELFQFGRGSGKRPIGVRYAVKWPWHLATRESCADLPRFVAFASRSAAVRYLLYAYRRIQLTYMECPEPDYMVTRPTVRLTPPWAAQGFSSEVLIEMAMNVGMTLLEVVQDTEGELLFDMQTNLVRECAALFQRQYWMCDWDSPDADMLVELDLFCHRVNRALYMDSDTIVDRLMERYEAEAWVRSRTMLNVLEEASEAFQAEMVLTCEEDARRT